MTEEETKPRRRKMGISVVGMDSLSERAAMMREVLQKSQTITDNVVSILGSFDSRLSALETAMRPTQVSFCFSKVLLPLDQGISLMISLLFWVLQIRTHAIRKAHENIDKSLKSAEVILAQFDLSRQVRPFLLFFFLIKDKSCRSIA